MLLFLNYIRKTANKNATREPHKSKKEWLDY